MRVALKAEPWRHEPMPAHVGAIVHRVERGAVKTRPAPNLQTMTDKPGAAVT